MFLTGIKGDRGEIGQSGLKGQKGEKGSPSQPSSVIGGVSYTRWGSTWCRSGSTLVYSGKVAGAGSHYQGGGSNYLCMPDDPQYSSFVANFQGDTFLYGTEYESNIHLHDSQYNAPCAVCYASNKQTSIMYPARTTCPFGWTIEYRGYLMSEHRDNYRSMYICVDESMEVIVGTSGHNTGGQFYHVESICDNVLYCPPYVGNKELTCVVCSK